MITNEIDQKIVDTTNKPRIRYTISEENMQKLIQQSICTYQHPIESTIREYAVNARDAMKLNNISKPIEITTPTALDPKLTIRDYGGGLTEQETVDLLFSFGASGDEKTKSNDYVGGFGIGSKSAFNLSNAFLFTVFKDGKKTVWNCMLDDRHQPTASKQAEVPTTEEDGILVTIPHEKFDEKQALSVLEWIDAPIILNGKPVTPAISCASLSGSVKSANGKLTFKWWLLDATKYSHAISKTWDAVFVTGCGAIPLKWDELPYEHPYNIRYGHTLPDYVKGSLVLELPIGSVHLVPSREAMQYDDYTKNTLVSAIDRVTADIAAAIAKRLVSSNTVETMAEAFADLASSMTPRDFKDVVSRAIGPSSIRGAMVRPNEMYKHVARTIEIGEVSGIEKVKAVRTQRGGRHRWGDWKFHMFNPAEPGELAKSWLSSATDATDWEDDILDEIAQMSSHTIITAVCETPGTGTPDSMRKSSANKFDLLAIDGYNDVDIYLYPSNAKSFISHFKVELSHFKPTSSSAPYIALQGDVPKMKEYIEKLMPDANISTPVVPCYKKKRKVNDGQRQQTQTEKHAPCGWLVTIETDKNEVQSVPSDPFGIARACMISKTQVNISVKSSLAMVVKNHKKPYASFSYANKTGNVRDSSFKPEIQAKTLDFVMHLLLCGADVMKDENGFPMIVVVEEGSDYKHIENYIVDRATLASKFNADMKEDDWTRYAMWLNTTAARLVKESHSYLGRSMHHDVLDDIFETTQGNSMTEPFQAAGEIIGPAILEMAGRRKLAKPFRTAFEKLAVMYEAPKKFPIPDSRLKYGNLSDVCPVCGFNFDSELNKAVKTLLCEVPVFGVIAGELSTAKNLALIGDHKIGTAISEIVGMFEARNLELLAEEKKQEEKAATKAAVQERKAS